MALAAILARKYDIARNWILILIDSLPSKQEAWGKGVWAIARMESLFEDRYSQAAFWYLELAANEQTPPRFRIQAMLRGFKYLSKSGNPVHTPEISKTIHSILVKIDDWRILLDAARQLTLAGSSFVELKLEATKRGAALADEAIANSQTSSEALVILEYLARRQYWDFGDAHGVSSRWNSLSSGCKFEFQAVGGSLWYEYLAVVFLALIQSNRVDQAESLVSYIIDDNKATSEGYVILGSAHAGWLLQKGHKERAFNFFQWVSREAPGHRKAAVAHYWLALQQLSQGNYPATAQGALAIRKCFSGRPALLEEWEYDAFAVLILNDLDIDVSLHASAGLYQRPFLEKVLSLMYINMKKI